MLAHSLGSFSPSLLGPILWSLWRHLVKARNTNLSRRVRSGVKYKSPQLGKSELVDPNFHDLRQHQFLSHNKENDNPTCFSNTQTTTSGWRVPLHAVTKRWPGSSTESSATTNWPVHQCGTPFFANLSALSPGICLETDSWLMRHTLLTPGTGMTFGQLRNPAQSKSSGWQTGRGWAVARIPASCPPLFIKPVSTKSGPNLRNH